MDRINKEIIFIFNDDESLKRYNDLDTREYKTIYYDTRKSAEFKLASKYLNSYKQYRVPFIIINKNKEIEKLFIQTKTNDSISDLKRYLENTPSVAKLNEMFIAFINKCKKHYLTKREILNLIEKYYE